MSVLALSLSISLSISLSSLATGFSWVGTVGTNHPKFGVFRPCSKFFWTNDLTESQILLN